MKDFGGVMICERVEIEGDKVFFTYSGRGERRDREERPIKPLCLTDISRDEYDWLKEKAVHPVRYRGWMGKGYDTTTYELIYNAQQKQVAIKWHGICARRLVLTPSDSQFPHYYDAITSEIARLQEALEKHKAGIMSGWDDYLVPGEILGEDS